MHYHASGCWEWLGVRGRGGYGRIGGRAAHRVLWEQEHGPIPAGMVLDHLCRVRACVNPAHMEPVSVRENTLRGRGPSAEHAARVRCLRGHLLPVQRNAQGRRECALCRKITRDRWTERQRELAL